MYSRFTVPKYAVNLLETSYPGEIPGRTRDGEDQPESRSYRRRHNGQHDVASAFQFHTPLHERPDNYADQGGRNGCRS